MSNERRLSPMEKRERQQKRESLAGATIIATALITAALIGLTGSIWIGVIALAVGIVATAAVHP